MVFDLYPNWAHVREVFSHTWQRPVIETHWIVFQIREGGWATTTRSTLWSRSPKQQDLFLLAVHGENNKSHYFKTTAWCLKLDKMFPDTICGQAGLQNCVDAPLHNCLAREDEEITTLEQVNAFGEMALMTSQSVFESSIQKEQAKLNFFLKRKYFQDLFHTIEQYLTHGNIYKHTLLKTEVLILKNLRCLCCFLLRFFHWHHSKKHFNNDSHMTGHKVASSVKNQLQKAWKSDTKNLICKMKSEAFRALLYIKLQQKKKTFTTHKYYTLHFRYAYLNT